MTARNEDFLFAQEAQSLGYVTEDQVEEGFELQKRMADDLRIDERLAVILVKRGWMAEEQARRVYGIIEPEGARTQIEGYRLVQKIGRGAMGTVYKAIHKGLHRVVAIKILRRDLAADKTQIERLRREAKLLADLDHPNIVRAFDAGESNGFPYLVMEYVEGETLRDRIARRGRLEDEEALRITRALADALEKARRMGIVHRDVKPGNILIGRGGTPKLMDLGLAKGPIDAGLTQHGATVGTPQFMSPEQAESPDKADTRSDIYSLGATLYAMVTGRPPFEGSTLAEIITKVMSQQPVPPRMRNPGVSPEVSHLIERMMLKDASLRYATPALVIEDIDLIRGGQSIIPVGFQGNWEAYLLRRRFLQWRTRIAVGLAVVLLAGGGLYLHLEAQDRERAEETVERYVADILDEPVALGDAEPLEALARVNAALVDARAKRDRALEIAEEGSVDVPRHDEINERIRSLEHDETAIQRTIQLEKRVLVLRQRGDFAEAAKLLVQSTSESRDFPWARRRWEALQQGVRAHSRKALEAALEKALAVPDADVEAFVAKWRDYRDVFEAPWLVDTHYEELRAAGEAAAQRASQIGVLVGEMTTAFAADEVHRRVAAREFYGLHTDLRRAAEALERGVEAHERTWPVGPWPAAQAPALPSFFGARGMVTGVVDEIRERIDREAEEAFAELERAAASEPLEQAAERYARFGYAAAWGSTYPDLARRAQARAKALREEADAQRALQQAAYEATVDRILAALRDGDGDAARAAVEHAGEGPPVSDAQQAVLRDLGAAAEALEAVQQAALRHAERQAAGGRATFDDVPIRTAGGAFATRKRIVVSAVDLGTGELVLRRARGGSRTDEERVSIRDVHPHTLRAWARSGERAVAERDLALVRLAELPAVADEQGVDLRPRLEAFRETLEDLRPHDLQSWCKVLEARQRALEDIQQRRREDAIRILTRLSRLEIEESPKLLIQYVELLLDPKGRVRWTGQAEKASAEMEQRAQLAREELARDELRRLFFGDVKPKHLPGSEKAFLFDFNDADQLRNFQRIFGLLQPAGPRDDTTPRDESGSLQLQLLPGVRGLLRDRPLALRNPFDPAERMAIEFTLFPQSAPALLAFDLDGVQVAIASMDPNVWRRRLDADVPRLEDDEKLPEYAFYGMGVGVAFHAGPHFGESFPVGNWDWATEGQGRNFARLRDRDYVAEQGGRLFAFDPGKTSYRVRIERWGGRLALSVDGKPVIEHEQPSWATRGARSPTNPRVRNGSGRLQILSWTPVVLDDLVLTGTITDEWKRQQVLVIERGDEPDEER